MKNPGTRTQATERADGPRRPSRYWRTGRPRASVRHANDDGNVAQGLVGPGGVPRDPLPSAFEVSRLPEEDRGRVGLQQPRQANIDPPSRLLVDGAPRLHDEVAELLLLEGGVLGVGSDDTLQLGVGIEKPLAPAVEEEGRELLLG